MKLSAKERVYWADHVSRILEGSMGPKFKVGDKVKQSFHSSGTVISFDLPQPWRNMTLYTMRDARGKVWHALESDLKPDEPEPKFKPDDRILWGTYSQPGIVRSRSSCGALYFVGLDNGGEFIAREGDLKPEPDPEPEAVRVIGGEICAVVPIEDDEIFVSYPKFLKMVEGREYQSTCNPNHVVKRHGARLIARKLETFHKLSELEG